MLLSILSSAGKRLHGLKRGLKPVGLLPLNEVLLLIAWGGGEVKWPDLGFSGLFLLTFNLSFRPLALKLEVSLLKFSPWQLRFELPQWTVQRATARVKAERNLILCLHLLRKAAPTCYVRKEVTGNVAGRGNIKSHQPTPGVSNLATSSFRQ